MSSTPSNTTTTTQLPDYAQSTAQEILNNANTLSQQQTPQYTGQTYAGLNGTQTGAINSIASMANNGLGSQNTQNVANSTLGGLTNTANNGGNNYATTTNPYIGQNVTASQNPYANSVNPALQSEITQANNAITNAYGTTQGNTLSQFGAGGAFGGSAMQDQNAMNNASLNTALTNSTNTLQNNAYNQAATLSGQQAALNTSTALANQSNNLQYSSADQALNSSNYNDAQTRALQAAGQASTTAAGADANNLAGQQSTLAAQQAALAAGTTQQTSDQNALNAQYQQWYSQAMSPYAQQGILQSGLAAALGNGAQGIASTAQTAGSGSAINTGVGVGTLGVGLINALK